MVSIVKKYNNMSIQVRAALWFTISNFLAKGMQFITTPIFTRIMSDYEYGRLSVAMSYQQLFYILATWEIAIGAYQRGIFLYEDEKDDYENVTLLNITCLTLFFFSLILIAHNFVNRITGLSDFMLLSLFLYILTYPPYICWMVNCRSNYKYKLVSVVSVFYAVITTCIPMAAVWIISDAAEVKYFFTILPSFIIGIIIFFKRISFRRIIKIGWESVKKYIIFNVQYQGPLVFHGLSYMILNQSDRIMIGKMCGNEEVAYYTVAYNFAWVGILLQDAMMQAIIPWLYKMMGEKEYDTIRKNLMLYILLLTGLLVGYILICPEIIKILFNVEYYDAIKCMPAIGISVFFVFLYNVFANIETFFNDTKYIMWVSVVCAAMNIILNYYFIGKCGYVASAYTTLFSYMIFCIGHYIFMNKVCEKNGCDGNKLINSKLICLIAFLNIGIMFIVVLSYKTVLIRYISILIIIAIGIIFRNKIINFLKKSKTRDIE